MSARWPKLWRRAAFPMPAPGPRIRPRHGPPRENRPVDAEMLAQMGCALRLSPTPPPDKTRAELADMMARREDIKAMMRAENNRLKQARLACVTYGEK